MVDLMMSQAFPAASIPCVVMKMHLPASARPAAVPIMSCSQSPMSRNLSGKRFRNSPVPLEPARSASITMMSTPRSARSISPRSYPLFVASVSTTL